MEEKNKKIRDMFLARQDLYRDKGLDNYTATQMAAQDTKLEFNLTKDVLTSILRGNE